MIRIRRTRQLGILWMMVAVLASMPPSSWAASIVPPNAATNNTQEEKHQSGGPSLDSDEATTTTPEQTKTKTTTAAKENTQSTGATSTKESSTTCRWGEHCPDTSANQKQQSDNTSQTEHHLPPFVSNKNSAAATPPEGFVITSRVYTDPDDKLAHFDTSSRIVLEYWECGASGSATAPLNVKHAYFRHAMPRAAPHLWSGTEYGTHPQLLVALKPLELLLNSGEQQVFDAGDVILLEDVLAAGHKIRSPNDHQDLSALLLTLPQHYHHVGKDRVSLTSRNKAIIGCQTSRDVIIREKVRKAVFAGIGLGISSLFAVFLGKVAPLWLSVGVGGICFITGGTYAAVQCGEYIWQEGELALERHRLKAQYQEEEEELIKDQVDQ